MGEIKKIQGDVVSKEQNIIKLYNSGESLATICKLLYTNHAYVLKCVWWDKIAKHQEIEKCQNILQIF